MAKDISYKDFFIRYGIFTGFVVIILFFCVYTTILSKKRWTNNLSYNVINVLTEVTGQEWSVIEPVSINNPFTLNSAAYKITNKSNEKDYISILIRINSIYGPIPAVFIVDDELNVRFAGYSNVHGFVKNQIDFEKYNNRVELYRQRMPSILGLNKQVAK